VTLVNAQGGIAGAGDRMILLIGIVAGATVLVFVVAFVVQRMRKK
jgi:hypothetical protein